MRSAIAAGAGVVALVVLLGLGGAATADEDDDGDSGGVTITVTVGTPTPTPTRTSTPAPTNNGSGGGSGGSTVVVVPPTPVPTPAPGDISIGGVLYMSGLAPGYRAELNPAGGSVVVQFTLKNVSSKTITSAADFKLSTWFGWELSSADDVLIQRLRPNESRVIVAELPNAGQWGLLNASVTLDPITPIDGERLGDFTRTTWVWYIPWLILVLLVLGLAAIVIVRVMRSEAMTGTGEVALGSAEVEGGTA